MSPKTTYKFLSKKEELFVVEAIQRAEKYTSGEIRVHIEPHSNKEFMERAKEVFFQLGMDKTKAKNGVLFYISIKDHVFTILGDTGIDEVVPKNFWDSIKDLVISEFKKGNFSKGLQLGIEKTGKKLKEFFPYKSNDKNELSDEISKK